VRSFIFDEVSKRLCYTHRNLSSMALISSMSASIRQGGSMLAPDTLVQSRYRIVRQIGQGGMGAVYQAVDQRLGNVVALKQTMVSGAQFSKAFEREARLLAMLRHPSLPKVIDHFADETGQFLVMEFIPGNDLAAMLAARGGPFPLDDVLRWGDQLLDALDYMHNQQPPIIHRDIKPQNIKITPRGEVILLDFGLAKGSAPQSNTTSTTGSVFGYTPQYAPLEQIQGAGTDPRSDLYALAATLHYLLTYAAPVNALTRASAVLGHQPDPLRPARELRPNIPAAVDTVLNQALALDIGERPANAAAMRAALAGALEMTRQTTSPQPTHDRRTIAITPDKPPAARTGAMRPARRGVGWAPLAAGAAVALLLLVGAALLFLNRPNLQPLISNPPTTSAAGAATLPPLATAELISAAPAAPSPSPEVPPTAPAATQRTSGLQVGQTALTRTPVSRELWSAAVGGDRVNERPRLFGGAEVKIMEIKPEAVQVRTPEGVIGWLHEPAEQALTADLSQIGALQRYATGVEVQVVWPNGIPVRVEPRSDAGKQLDRLAAGQGGLVQQVLGDWLYIQLEQGKTGWVRWYYDGKIYVDLASAQAPPSFGRILLVQTPRLEGDDVRAIQERLSMLGYWPGDADGIYGPTTEEAVKSFQTNNSLDVDGIIGRQTWERLFSPEAAPYEDE
jgi:serine/threonine protein kinase